MVLLEENRYNDSDYLNVELRRRYPLVPLAQVLGVSYAEEVHSGDIAYQSEWSNLVIRKDSELGRLLQLPFMERLRDIGQLGPNRTYPYQYTHSVFDHEAEQLVRIVPRLAFFAETKPDLFLEGSRQYRVNDANQSDHVYNILRLAEWWIILHDAESLPLRDTAKFAFRTKNTVTDENLLLVQRLQNPRDIKYRPYLRDVFGDHIESVIQILTRIAKREEYSFIGELLHSPPLPDTSDPTGFSIPLDGDRITYTIQDLVRILGQYVFHNKINPLDRKNGVEFFLETLYRVRTIKRLQFLIDSTTDPREKKIWEDLISLKKIHPSQIDLMCNAVLARGRDGGIHIAYDNPQALRSFLCQSSLSNFPGLYLAPAMIFTEKQFEMLIKKRLQGWSKGKQKTFVRKMTDWTDGMFRNWLQQHWPETLQAIGDDAYEYQFDWSYVREPEHTIEQVDTDVISVPIKIRSASSTFILHNDQAVPFSSVPGEATRIYRENLTLYDGRRLVVRKVKKPKGI